MTQAVLTDIKNGIATVTLNRPDKKNAMSFEMMTQIVEAAENLRHTDKLRAVILTGAGGCFCSGIDVGNLMAAAQDMAGIRARMLNPTTHAPANEFQAPATIWATLDVPVIAAIQGVCFGAGAQLALGADFRIAAPNSRFAIMEAKWGLIPDMGLTNSLPKLMRADQAMDLIMTGRVLDAPEALSVGLLTRLADDPMAAAQEFTAQLAAKSPDALAASKKLVNGTWGNATDGLKLEAALQEQIMGRPNQMEMVAASLGKRAPNFG